MSKIYDGGPAFPTPAFIDPETGQTIYHPAAAIEAYKIADEMLERREAGNG